MAEIRRLDALLSRHDPASELSRLNASEGMAVSPELFEVLEQGRILAGGVRRGVRRAAGRGEPSGAGGRCRGRASGG